MFEQVYKIKLPEKYTSSQLMQLFSAYKGHVTGRGLPDEYRAARTILKDYCSGKLLFVHLRPDYNSEIHGEVNQTNIKYVLQNETPSASGNEESKEEVISSAADESLNTESAILSQATNETSENLDFLQNRKEEDFDKGFFTEKKVEVKMNKAQRRALKFAAKRGQNPDEVDLNDPNLMGKSRKKHIAGYDKSEQKKGPRSNKITHFSNLQAD